MSSLAVRPPSSSLPPTGPELSPLDRGEESHPPTSESERSEPSHLRRDAFTAVAAASRSGVLPIFTHQSQLRALADAVGAELALHRPLFQIYDRKTPHPAGLSNPEPAEYLRHFARMDAIQRELESISSHELTHEDRLMADWIRLALRDCLSLRPGDRYLWELGSFNDELKVAGLDALMDAIQEREDVLKVAAALADAPRFYRQVERNLRDAAARGYRLPRLVLDRVVASLDRDLAAPPGRREFREVAKRLSPAWKLSDRLWVRRTLRDAALKGLVPAEQRFRDFLAHELEGRQSIGLSEVPNGKALYEGLAFHFTGSTRSASEWHRVGLERVERVKEKMMVVGRRLFPDATSFDELIARIASTEWPRPGSAEELEELIRSLIDRAQAALPTVWGQQKRALNPLTAVGIEHGGTEMASYAMLPGEEVGFMMYDSTSREPNHNWAHAVFHEYAHHLQEETPPPVINPPALLRDSSLYDNAVVEGQALYTEGLAAELGLFETDLEKLGQLNAEMERAVRLVVDTGIHTLGWSREKAIDFYRSHTIFDAQTAANEIDRYIANPAQALSYMAGLIEIEAMRANAEAQLGDRFDLKGFNAALLSSGGHAPMSAVKAAVGGWVHDRST